MTVTVGAGVTIAQLQSALSKHRQRLALDPLWPERATVGGVIATNDSGALRLRYGGIRDLIIGITVVIPDGTIAISGGKVVKNVAGYDLPKLMSGASARWESSREPCFACILCQRNPKRLASHSSIAKRQTTSCSLSLIPSWSLPVYRCERSIGRKNRGRCKDRWYCCGNCRANGNGVQTRGRSESQRARRRSVAGA